MDLGASISTRQHASAWRRDDHHSLLLTAMMWTLIVLMIVPEGLDYQVLASAASPSSGSAVSRMLWLGLLGLAAVIVLWRPGLAWLLARTANPFLLLFVALAFASVAWSIDPSLSLRRLVRMGTIVLACAAFVLMGWHGRRYQNVVRPILTAMLLGSIVFGLVFPALAIHQETSVELAGAWHGLANHKNGLGALACITLIFWLHGWLAGEVKALPALAGGVLAALCLVLSRSSTSLAATGVVIVFLILCLRAPQNLRRYVPLLVGALVALLLVYALAIMNVIPGMDTLLAPITAFTNKNVTLTGRTEIWSILYEHISYHPLLGTGYAAFWTASPIPGGDSYAFIWRMGGFYPGSAHNGYIEVANDLGFVGLLLLAGYIATLIWQSLRLLPIDGNQAILYLALFFQQIITNLSETHWFSVLSVDFVLITLATLALARGLLEYQLRQVFGAPHPSFSPPAGASAAGRPGGGSPAGTGAAGGLLGGSVGARVGAQSGAQGKAQAAAAPVDARLRAGHPTQERPGRAQPTPARPHEMYPSDEQLRPPGTEHSSRPAPSSSATPATAPNRMSGGTDLAQHDALAGVQQHAQPGAHKSADRTSGPHRP